MDHHSNIIGILPNNSRQVSMVVVRALPAAKPRQRQNRLSSHMAFPRELRNKDQEMLAPANFAGQLRASSVLRMGPVVRSVAKNIPLCGPRVDVRMRIVGVEGVLAVLPVS